MTIPFRPRFPWVGGDLQTLRNIVAMEALRVGRIDLACERHVLPLEDGSGDALVARLSEPPDGADAPLAVVVHGLTGCSESSYVLVTARHLLSHGYPVLRINLRGAGESRATSAGCYHAGASGDLALALNAFCDIRPDLLDHGVLPVGYSLGGNMLLRFLAEEAADFPVRAAAVVSAPIDLAATSRRFMRRRNALYHRWLLDRMRHETFTGGLSDAERAAVAEARTVYEFDDRFIARRFGFGTADRYYAECSGLNFLSAIRAPTLVVHAADDPWIPVEPYLTHDWCGNPALTPLLAESGGHVGFHAAGDRVPWHDRRIARFFGEHVRSPAGNAERRAEREEMVAG